MWTKYFGLSNMLWKTFQFTYGEHQIEINIILSFWFVGTCHKCIVTKNIFKSLKHHLLQLKKGKLIIAHWGIIDLKWMLIPLNPCSFTFVVQTSSTNNNFHPKNFIYFSSIWKHVVKYFATSAKILSNVTRNILYIFLPHYKKW